VSGLVTWVFWSLTSGGFGPGAHGDTEAAALACCLCRVALRCLGVVYGLSGNLPIDSCLSAVALGLVWCVLCCISFSYEPSNSFAT
jgi:hypothetical protein